MLSPKAIADGRRQWHDRSTPGSPLGHRRAGHHRHATRLPLREPYGLAGTTEVIPQLAQLAAAFRAAGRPIVHIVRLYQPDGSNADLLRRTLLASVASIVRPGTPGRLLAPALSPGAADLDDEALLAGKAQELAPGEYAIYKPRWGAFYRTPLDSLLAAHGVDTLVFAGCNMPNCPRASIIEASERDYRIVLAIDAVSQSSEQGLREIAAIGAILMPTNGIAAAVAR